MFYTQPRIGKNHKEFLLLKFRSMVDHAESGTGPVWAATNDPRITRCGRFLRKCRLDELPQFLNVLKGDMSIIGPRPERKLFFDTFIRQIPLYSRRIQVKPGITGLAQVRYKYDENIDDVSAKLTYDLFYIEKISMLLDLRILWETIPVILKGTGR